MKKNDLLKVTLICFAIFVILSWIIPIGSYSTGAFVAGETAPIGLFQIFYYPIVTIGTIIQYGVVFLAIGGFYGVMNKTGMYQKLVDNIVKKFNKREKTFVIITIIAFALLSSLSGLPLALFALIPLFIAVILKMGYSKIVAFTSTVGAILVGGIGATYGLDTIAHSNYILDLDINNYIFAKIIILVLVTFLLIMFVLKSMNTKKTTKKEEEKIEIPLLEKSENTKKNLTPMIVIFALTIIIILISMYNWYYGLNILFFNDLYEKLIAVNINDYPIVKNIIGISSPIGYWGTYEMATVLLIASLLIGWIYSLKIKDILTAFADGSKKMINIAFYAILANIIFTLMLVNSEGSMIMTITNAILSMTDKFNIFTTTLLTMIGSFFYNNFYYLGNSILPQIAETASAEPKEALGVIGILVQSIYSLMMLILPTSYVMIAGLSMLDISFKEWFKYIWKYLLEVFILIIIISAILLMIL